MSLFELMIYALVNRVSTYNDCYRWSGSADYLKCNGINYMLDVDVDDWRKAYDSN